MSMAGAARMVYGPRQLSATATAMRQLGPLVAAL